MKTECLIDLDPSTVDAESSKVRHQSKESSNSKAQPQIERGNEKRQGERSADMVRRKKLKKLKNLNNIVFVVAILEWAGNTIGTVAFIWATVVLLGGFCSLLSYMDFWFSAVMVFMEGSRVFIRNDASINQWLFGSTTAFRWDDFSRMLVPPAYLNMTALFVGLVFASSAEFLPEIVASIMKVVLLVIISQLLTRLRKLWIAYIVFYLLLLVLLAAMICALVYLWKTLGLRRGFWWKTRINKTDALYKKRLIGSLRIMGMTVGMIVQAFLRRLIISFVPFLGRRRPLLCLKFVIALGLACWPILQSKLSSNFKYSSIAIAVVLLSLGNLEPNGSKESSEPNNRSSKTLHQNNSSSETLEQNNSSSETLEQNKNSSLETSKKNNNYSAGTLGQNKGLLLQVVETILPTLFIWSVMFPLPGISLKLSFIMLGSVLAAVLFGNLQIPVAFLQVLLSGLRLGSLLGHHHHDYRPLPHDASPNLVPSIVVFFMLELCQGSTYILAVILGFCSFLYRTSIVRDLEIEEKWGLDAVNLYYRQAYQARTEKGLFSSDKEKNTPSLETFAIQSLGGTSSYEMQVLGIRILYRRLQQEEDSKSKRKLIAEIVKDAKNIVTNIIGLVCYLTDEDNSGDPQKKNRAPRFLSLLTGGENSSDTRNTCLKKMVRTIFNITGKQSSGDPRKKKKEEQMEAVHLSLEFVRSLAMNQWQICASFRKELSENAIFLDSLERILDFDEDGQPELKKLVVDIIKSLDFDEDGQPELKKLIDPKLIHAFLMPEYHSLRMAAGEELENLTANSRDNCRAILLADRDNNNNLMKNLVNMLEEEDCKFVAAKLLLNLSVVNIGFDANMQPALEKAKQIVMTNKEGEQLEAPHPGHGDEGVVIESLPMPDLLDKAKG